MKAYKGFEQGGSIRSMRKKTVRWTVFADVVRSRARPVDDEASVTMRSGRKLSALQAENNFREPQEAERSEAIDAGASD